METTIWEPLEAKYKPEIIALAQGVAKDLREYGAHYGWKVSDVSDFTDSDLAVFFLVESDEHEPIDVTFRLLDAYEWDGEPNGTSFSCDITAEGGRIVGGLHPFNYSSKVWVDPTDADAVEERWELFRDAAHSEDIARLIAEFWDREEN